MFTFIRCMCDELAACEMKIVIVGFPLHMTTTTQLGMPWASLRRHTQHDTTVDGCWRAPGKTSHTTRRRLCEQIKKNETSLLLTSMLRIVGNFRCRWSVWVCEAHTENPNFLHESSLWRKWKAFSCAFLISSHTFSFCHHTPTLIIARRVLLINIISWFRFSLSLTFSFLFRWCAPHEMIWWGNSREGK